MTRVTVAGWKSGLNKIELSHLMRRHAGYGLAASKRAVDRLLDRECLTLELPDSESANTFCRSASDIGAICHVSTVPQDAR